VKLHFHDLRREFGSRLLESGASHHDVRDFLGHSNITTTSRYLKSSIDRLEKTLAAMEGSAICPSFAQSDKQTEIDATENQSTDAQNSLTDDDLVDGGEGQNRTVRHYDFQFYEPHQDSLRR